MYSTSAHHSPSSARGERTSDSPTPSHSHSHSHSPAPPLSRKQVARACDWCRARRVKCNNERPCRACQQKGVPCVDKSTDEPRSFPQALREIDRLKNRIRELEGELEACHISLTAAAANSIPTPSGSNTASVSNHDSTDSHAISRGDSSLSTAYSRSASAQWDGICVATARSEQTSYYGPSSSFYFISRIGAYISRTFQQPFQERAMQLRGMSQTLANPASVVDPDTSSSSSTPGSASIRAPCPSMSRTQEEFFLSTFWEGLNCSMPIVDEADFRRHYNSLWEPEPSGSVALTARKDSALVDIMLAVCLQSSSTLLPRGATPAATQPGLQHDATIVGRWHFRRYQCLSVADMESPTLATIQGHLFSIVYLCYASFQNTSHAALAQAIRHATVLGLHREPPASLSHSERELRKRIWWVLFAFDVKTCTNLGRPFAIHPGQVSVTLPSDDANVASLSGSSLGVQAKDGITWLSYALHYQKLTRTISDVYHVVWEQYGEILAARDLTSPYKHPDVLEKCADVLAAQIPALQAWVDQVPPGLKTARLMHGRPFSLDRSPLDIDTMAPTYLQRQRLYLEMNYHTLVVNLYRPFITFYHNPGTHYTPATERHAAACVDHGIAHILIMHQAVHETTLLAGWHEFFLLHWNSTMVVIGFLLAHPIHASTAHARDAVEKSIEVCDVFGAHFGVAASAASIARSLLAKVDQVISHMSSGIFGEGPNNNMAEPQPGALLQQCPGQDAGGWNTVTETGGNGLGWLDPRQPEDPEQFGEFMDWALTVDSFNSLGQFFAPTNEFGM